jgi:putative CocE/NonD family hydrolase
MRIPDDASAARAFRARRAINRCAIVFATAVIWNGVMTPTSPAQPSPQAVVAEQSRPSPQALAAEQGRHAAEQTRRDAAAALLPHIADREDMVRITMRDGARLNGTLLFPKGKPRNDLPTVLIFFPYGIEGATQHFMVQSLLASGYAIAIVNERGRYYSDGTYTFLGGVGKDSSDTIDWLAKQPWSNGKVGAIGCSSSAEEQNMMNAMQNPHFAAAVPMSPGAGIGKVGPYNEMGSFYRGGVVENLWYTWYPTAGYTYRPAFPPNLSREDMLRLGRYWTLDPNVHPPTVSLDDPVIWTLPENQILARLHAMPSDLDDLINRLPNDPRWNEVEFGKEGERNGAPTLYVNAWYDHSIEDNLAMYEYQRKNAANATARDNTFMIIAPTPHCRQTNATEHTVVGERDMGDARYDYVTFIQRWYDHWLKGIDNGIEKGPKVRAYLMGKNDWRTYDTWPPPAARPVTYYLDSNGGANTRKGDGRLTMTAPARAGMDGFTYDPMNPRPSKGGQAYPTERAGAENQAAIEMRQDVLVYTTPPLTQTLEVTGDIKVTLYLSSDVKDTDLMVKLVDVYPDNHAYNLDEGVQRVRWRDGYDKPVFMERGKVYKVAVPPLVTSNAFLPGHRIRIEVSSSAFPMLERNLNTGGNNYDEKDWVFAHNVIHHAPNYRSEVILPVMPASGSSTR